MGNNCCQMKFSTNSFDNCKNSNDIRTVLVKELDRINLKLNQIRTTNTYETEKDLYLYYLRLQLFFVHIKMAIDDMDKYNKFIKKSSTKSIVTVKDTDTNTSKQSKFSIMDDSDGKNLGLKEKFKNLVNFLNSILNTERDCDEDKLIQFENEFDQRSNYLVFIVN